MKIKQYRYPIVEEVFYPSDPEKLNSLLTPLEPRGNMNFLQLPHGNWDYLFPCLEKAWPRVSPGIKRILMVGPVHREGEPHLAVPGNRSFVTPLGNQPLASRELRRWMEKTSTIKLDQRPHEEEHCLEMHLPMVHRFFPKIRILPLIMGPMDRGAMEQAAAVLGELQEVKEELLIILSGNTGDFLPMKEAEQQWEQVKRWIENPPTFPEILDQCPQQPACFSLPLALMGASGLLPEKLELIERTPYNEDGKTQLYSSWGGVL